MLTATARIVLLDVLLGDCWSADFALAMTPEGSIEVWPGVDFDGEEITVPMLTAYGHALLDGVCESEAA